MVCNRICPRCPASRPSAICGSFGRCRSLLSFAYFKVKVLALGFVHVESGPLVRSAYHAEQQLPSPDYSVRREKALCDLQVQVLPGELSGPPSSYQGDQKGN